MLCPNNIVRLNRHKERVMETKHMTQGFYIVYNSKHYKVSQKLIQNQNVSGTSWNKTVMCVCVCVRERERVQPLHSIVASSEIRDISGVTVVER